MIGDYITRRIRSETFYKMLKMPVSWFDISKNNVGNLSTKLSIDCQLVNAVTTTTFSIEMQNLATLLTGIVIAFVYEWRTALVALGLLPLIIFVGATKMAINTIFGNKKNAAYKNSSNLIMETIINIRTVSSFGYEGVIAKKYDLRM